MEFNNKYGGIAARERKGLLWKFTSRNDGSFKVPFADYISRLFFPLMNEHGMKSSITPELKGDIVSSFQNYLTAATVTEELHRNVSGRNFWVVVKGEKPWSVSGNSAFQKAEKWTSLRDESEVEGYIGAFVIRRKNAQLGIESGVTVFVPVTDDFVELMKVSIKNISDKPLTFVPTSAIPIFGRHADNFRDHRQVTTMFQKVFVENHGVRVRPTIVHDEHGHAVNKMNYAVLGFEGNGNRPSEIWPVMADFIGEGGSLDNPEAVFNHLPAPVYSDGAVNGREAIGAMRYREKTLAPGELAEYIIIHGITDNENDIGDWGKKFGSAEKFNLHLENTLNYWRKVSTAVAFDTGDHVFDNWVKWVAFQLKCRQIFGNSYLPDFGYGRGGRGWRDLWQDLLSIFLVDPAGAREEILNNFRGVRLDGSNATIIGTKPGEFIADRNNVPRTWCDHGAWPVFVLDFYIQQTGDLEILFKELPYWKDVFSHRCKSKDQKWSPSQGYQQLDETGKVYYGSVLEHIIVQQLTAFFNVGEHNNLLLEGGDWNDTLDMAREKGESVCFHNFYSYNLSTIANILIYLHAQGYKTIDLLSEILLLLDRLPNQSKVDYNLPEARQNRLNRFFGKIGHKVSGSRVEISIKDLIKDLQEKSSHISEHIRKNEWVTTSEGYGFFNGHYDNNGQAVHGDTEDGVLMDLTSQVMPVMCGVADDAQIEEMIRSAKRYLKDPDSPGLRLCTDFKRLNLNIGRITGFTYGYKEHGSKWSQQNIMFAYGLYRRGFAEQGFEIFKELFQLCTDSPKALIFPGIPSYFEPVDRGAYAYLTGSSTWLLLTLTTQIFGVDGWFGDLLLHPRLDRSFFNASGQAAISRNFRELRLHICYHNNQQLSYPDYRISQVIINGRNLDINDGNHSEMVIPYKILVENSMEKTCQIEVILETKEPR
ncbi:MAG: cellobiose phosphorylase [Bacteroidales bacterium]|nr:cellobiose phosphorylase [Bacteroidales bacterium]